MDARKAEQDQSFNDLHAVRVAKDIFLSPWYANTSEEYFDGESRLLLRRIAEDSRKERDEALALVREWTRHSSETGELRGTTAAIRAMARHDFLNDLIQIKQESADVFQKIALLAPSEFRERFLKLALVDVEHAMWLRDILRREFPDPQALLAPPKKDEPGA